MSTYYMDLSMLCDAREIYITPRTAKALKANGWVQQKHLDQSQLEGVWEPHRIRLSPPYDRASIFAEKMGAMLPSQHKRALERNLEENPDRPSDKVDAELKIIRARAKQEAKEKEEANV